MNYLDSLKQIVRFAYQHTPFYHELYDRMSIDISNITDINELPIVTPEDLRTNEKKFKSDIQLYKVAMTSGTTSLPKIVYRTEEDFSHSVKNEIILLQWAGIQSKDVVCVVQPFGINGYGELTAEACRCLNVFCIPLGDVSTETLINTIETFDVSILDITPSRLFSLINHPDFHIEKTKLRLAMVAGEIFCEEFRKAIFDSYKIQIVNQYGSTECDCLAGEKVGEIGLNCFTNDFIYEIINNKLVVTSLYHKGTPLIRYMIGDNAEFCNGFIVIHGRDDSFQLFDGIKIESSALSRIIHSHGGLQWQCLIFKKRNKICLEIHYSTIRENYKESTKLKNEIVNSLDFWNIGEEISVECICTTKMLTDGQRKATKFIDLRNGNIRYFNELLKNEWFYILNATLPQPLTRKRMIEISNELKNSSFEFLWPALLYFIHIWSPQSRKIADLIIVECLKSEKKQLLQKAQKLSVNDNWEIREDAAKLVGFILKNDFYVLYGWAKKLLQSKNERLRRSMLVGLKYCAQYEIDMEKHRVMLNLLDLLLYDKSRYVLKSFDSFTLGDGFLNLCPSLVDNKLFEWAQLGDTSIKCKIIRVFKSSGGIKNREIAKKYLDMFSNLENSDLQRACNQTYEYLKDHSRKQV